MQTGLERWVPPLERMPFVADRRVCIQAMQMWLLGEPESSVLALLNCKKAEWEKWKRDESFGYLVNLLDTGELGWVKGGYIRLTTTLLNQLQDDVDNRAINPKTKVALLSKLVDRQLEMEKRAKTEEDEVPEEVRELWRNLKERGKRRMKEIEGEVIDADASA